MPGQVPSPCGPRFPWGPLATRGLCSSLPWPCSPELVALQLGWQSWGSPPQEVASSVEGTGSELWEVGSQLRWGVWSVPPGPALAFTWECYGEMVWR